MLSNTIFVDATQTQSQFRSKDQAYRNRFTVTKIVIAGDFDGMGQRMPIVERCASPTLSFIAGNNGSLNSDAGRNLFVDWQCVEAFTTEEVVLRDFAESAAVLTRRQRRQQSGIADNP